MRVDPRSLNDGATLLNGGMNASVLPSAIAPNQYAKGVNVTARGGFITTRPGWRQRQLTFPSGAVQTAFEDGLFQGAFGFEPYGDSPPELVVSIAGRLYRILVEDRYRVQDMTAGFSLSVDSSTAPKAWFEQAEDFLIRQDNISAPLIYDGAIVRRVSPSAVPKEIPVGNAMTYGLGRLWVALPAGRSFVASNIVYGEDGSAPYNSRDAVLKFTENNFLNGGGEFSIPVTAGLIRAIRTLANLDTSLGQGPVQVFTDRGAFSVSAPFNRDAWAVVQYPIQTVSLLGRGASSQEAAVLVNGDIWFRAADGIRSFQIARRDQGSWVNTPVSAEVSNVLNADDTTLLTHASGALFDNRYLSTVSPFRVKDHGVANRGMVVVDFHNVSSLLRRSSPIYDGIWTGLDILQVVALKDRCFLFTLAADNDIELWELTKADYFDLPVSNTPTRIACSLETRSFRFTDDAWERKELTTGDIWVSDLMGTVNWSAAFRPDRYPDYVAWHSWSTDSQRETCLTSCSIPSNLQPQYRTRMRLPLPSESCNAKVSMPFRQGFEFQLRLNFTGHARIEKIRLIAHQKEEDTLPFCEPSEATDTTGVTGCDQDDLFSYQSVP